MFIPANTSLGSLNPLGMSMLTHRNIEYVIFIYSLILLLLRPSTRKKSVLQAGWFSLLAVLLISSDRLFIPFYVGAILVLLFVRILKWLISRRQEPANIARPSVYLALTLTISGASYLLIDKLDYTAVFYFPVEGGNELVPYDFRNSFEMIWKGTVASFNAITQNIGGVSALNIALLFIALAFYIIILVRDLTTHHNHRHPDTTAAWGQDINAHDLLHLMFGAAIVAWCSFALTDHNYPNDARYLTIVLFCVVLALTTLLTHHPRHPDTGAAWGQDLSPHHRVHYFATVAALILVVNIILGGVWQYTTALDQKQAYSLQDDRNQSIVDIFTSRSEIGDPLPPLLVGDYWRVVNVASLGAQRSEAQKQGDINDSDSRRLAKLMYNDDEKERRGEASPSNLPIQPVATNNCLGARRGNLTTIGWRQFDFEQTSFTLLLTLDGTDLADFPKCTFDDAVATFGLPNETLTVVGSESEPKEVLWVYRH
jgi:hypothetical protein